MHWVVQFANGRVMRLMFSLPVWLRIWYWTHAFVQGNTFVFWVLCFRSLLNATALHAGYQIRIAERLLVFLVRFAIKCFNAGGAS